MSINSWKTARYGVGVCVYGLPGDHELETYFTGLPVFMNGVDM